MQRHPTLYADEIRDRLLWQRGRYFKLHVIYYALKKLGYSKKKCWVHPKEADELQEYLYWRHFGQNNYQLNQLVFFDESYVDCKSGIRKNGWSLVYVAMC